MVSLFNYIFYVIAFTTQNLPISFIDIETLQRSKIQIEIELEEKLKKESMSREHLEKAVNIEKAEWKREIEKWRIEKNDLFQKWTR